MNETFKIINFDTIKQAQLKKIKKEPVLKF